ncbi:MAG: adenosylcobinamide-phosphate synthase CbiB [Bryobacteraceae bacterium]|nr:adenosylcobinamide-phosphate synthase CbiB [Bryobacteraceae bacterium]
MTSGTQLLCGAALDLALGDPRWLPHPVRGIGWLIVKLEPLCRHLPLYAGGILLWLLVVGTTAGIVWLTLPWLAIFWIWTFLAVRDLDVQAMRVIAALRDGDLAGARERLSMIVGRDTASLDEPEILRATVETVAESLSDGIVGPLFYLALAGPAGMAAFKAASTLDSMCGYRNVRYREFGWASARLDDVANFLPARLSVALVAVAALLMGYDARAAIRCALRDGASQPSPNSGYPEAAVAGALGVRLGGLNYYQGVPSVKATLGEPRRPLSLEVFRATRHLLYGTSALAVLLAWSVSR